MYLYAIIFLFFLQLLADFIEAIYAFGLMGTSIPVEIVSVLFLFSPLLWMFSRRSPTRRTLLALTIMMLVARLAYPLLDTRGKMLAAGVGTMAFFLLLPALLSYSSSRNPKYSVVNMGSGLLLGLAASILLRAFGSGGDISTVAWTQGVGWVLALIALLHLRHFGENQLAIEGRALFSRLAALSVGMIASLALLYFAFSAPNVIARWTGVDYLWITVFLIAALVGYAFLAGQAGFWSWLSPGKALAWNALFLVSLVFTISPHQIRFPTDPSAYPLHEPSVSSWAALPLVFLLLSSPVILLDFTLFARRIISLRPSMRQLGGGFTLAAVFLALVIFAHVFTTVYDYVPVVGPFFRDKFWLVFLAVGLGMTLPVLAVHRENFEGGTLPKNLFLAVLGMGTLALFTAALVQARPTPVAPKLTLRLMSYNIQQGYSEHGLKNFDAQLEVIRAWDADVIGLQESDTNRIAGGNCDVVRYFADRLNMYSYYGPKTVVGTFGVALLSRYPIWEARTIYMYSEGEQTATIQAIIAVDGREFNVFVTHLGNEGPIVQQEAILKAVDNLENVILMGDFNFPPESAPYRLTVQELDDAWLLRWLGDVDDQGVDPHDRIDHLFVSPGMNILEARYIFSAASDHPALGVEIGW